MTVRTIVGFVAAFPSDREGDGAPAGRLLAEFIATNLRSTGFNLLGPNERQGWAWDMSATKDSITVNTTVGLVDDMESTPPRQWLVTNDYTVSIWNRIFGSRSQHEQRDRSIRRYCEAIQKIMESDGRFSQILWSNKATFDRPGDSPGYSP